MLLVVTLFHYGSVLLYFWMVVLGLKLVIGLELVMGFDRLARAGS